MNIGSYSAQRISTINFIDLEHYSGNAFFFQYFYRKLNVKDGLIDLLLMVRIFLVFRLDCGVKTFRNEGFFGMYRGK